MKRIVSLSDIFIFIFFKTCFFYACIYPLILSFETINKLKLSFECGIPRPQDVGHLRF
jgi:hypothetical protein